MSYGQIYAHRDIGAGETTLRAILLCKITQPSEIQHLRNPNTMSWNSRDKKVSCHRNAVYGLRNESEFANDKI